MRSSLILLVACLVTGGVLTTDPFQVNANLGRGINIGNALEAPNEGDWGVTIQASYFTIIRQKGFTSVRIPVKWSGHALQKGPYTIDSAFFARVETVVKWALSAGLSVILNVHNYDEIMTNPDGHILRLLSLWTQIGSRFKGYPASLLFELLNEPSGALTRDKWNSFIPQIISTIRQSNPTRTLMVMPAEWGSYYSLVSLIVPATERNIIVSIHFYDPVPFTHQGAEWMTPEYQTVGVVWPGPPAKRITPVAAVKNLQWMSDWFTNYNSVQGANNVASPQTMEGILAGIKSWAVKNNRPINLGEFGAYSKADFASRILWTTAVKNNAITQGFSFNYWEFCSGFGVYNATTGKWNGLEQALLQ